MKKEINKQSDLDAALEKIAARLRPEAAFGKEDCDDFETSRGECSTQGTTNQSC